MERAEMTEKTESAEQTEQQEDTRRTHTRPERGGGKVTEAIEREKD
jgi:hypothetical protein